VKTSDVETATLNNIGITAKFVLVRLQKLWKIVHPLFARYIKETPCQINKSEQELL
jgi:hypothetical protein